MSAAILLADDNGDARAAWRRSLEAAGLEVLEAATVSDALRIVQSLHPHVIVTDLGFDERSGADLCRVVRSDGSLRSMRLVVITGRHGPGARAALRDVAPDAVLVKPFDLDQIVAVCVGLCRPGDRPPPE